MIVLDASLAVAAADPHAVEILLDLGPRPADRLPGVLEAPVHAWYRDGAPDGELNLEPIPGVGVRAVYLGEPDAAVGILVERVCTRETLETATERFHLSPRERDVLRLLLEGDSACEIADRLGIVEYTVGDYIKRIFAKTRVRNRAEMIAKVLGWHVPSALAPVQRRAGR
jgi:DNA-binding CsgD family transcriptional regulator